jgi:hypothetical protein
MSGASDGGTFRRLGGDDPAKLNGSATVMGPPSSTGTLVVEGPRTDESLSPPATPKETPARRSGSAHVRSVPTADLFPPGLKPRRRGRMVALVTLGVVAVAAVAAVAAWALTGSSSSVNGGTSANAVVSSVRTTVAKGTAALSLTMQVRSAGSTPMIATGSGAVDLGTDASRVLFTFHGPGPLAGEQLKEVFVGDTIYLSLPQLAGLVAGKPWISQSLTPTALIAPRNSDPDALLAMLGAGGNQVVPLGPSHIGGTVVEGYRVTIRPAGLQARLSTAGLPAGITGAAEHAAGTTTDAVTVYIADGTGQVRRLVTDEDLSLGSHPVVAVVTEDLGGYGTSVAVSPPPAAQVQTLSQFQAAAQGAAPKVTT